MLQNKIIKQENAVEKYFCEPFDKVQRVPMSEENTGFLMKLLMMKGLKEPPEKDKPFLIKVIESRLKTAFSFSIKDNRLRLFIAIISQTPGTAIMYLTYLQYWCKKNKTKEIDLEKFCDIFPMGFLNEKDLEKIWDGQKVLRGEGGSDNLLDYQSAMLSIHFLQPAQP